MNTLIRRVLAAAGLMLATALPAIAQAQDVAALLKAADRYRTGSDNLQVETLVQVYKTDGSLDKERRYTVFAQAKHQSLVLMQSPAEKGQKQLSAVGERYVMALPDREAAQAAVAGLRRRRKSR